MNKVKQITNLNELKEEIALLKIKINEHEASLQQRAQAIPRKFVGSSIGTIAAFFISKKLASSTWDILKIASRVVLNKTPAAVVTNTLAKNARAIGLFTVAKGLFNTITKRFSAKSAKQKG